MPICLQIATKADGRADQCTLFCLQIASRAGEMPGEDGQVFAEVWWWRELMQRLMDGCATTDHMLAAGLAAYEELPGPNVPVTSGYQVQSPCLS